jgi:hypothetical protein
MYPDLFGGFFRDNPCIDKFRQCFSKFFTHA